MADSAITLHPLNDIGRGSTAPLTQARNAHCFGITDYTGSAPAKRRPKDGDDAISSRTGTPSHVPRDLLVVGCRKKVVLYGAGKSGLREAWVSAFFIMQDSAELAGTTPTAFASEDHHPILRFVVLVDAPSGVCSSDVLFDIDGDSAHTP